MVIMIFLYLKKIVTMMIWWRYQKNMKHNFFPLRMELCQAARNQSYRLKLFSSDNNRRLLFFTSISTFFDLLLFVLLKKTLHLSVVWCNFGDCSKTFQENYVKVKVLCPPGEPALFSSLLKWFVCGTHSLGRYLVCRWVWVIEYPGNRFIVTATPLLSV